MWVPLAQRAFAVLQPAPPKHRRSENIQVTENVLAVFVAVVDEHHDWGRADELVGHDQRRERLAWVGEGGGCVVLELFELDVLVEESGREW
jgi:hypothetical protein